ncbi:MAG: YbdD/YjiX family protein [Burkholderiales bacterium]
MPETLNKVWQLLREISGDDAYDKYLQHHARAHPLDPLLSRKAFVEREQERKWNGVTRCC